MTNIDTIAAIATPLGNGGIGIIRISGKLVKTAAHILLKKIPKPRQAEYLSFYNKNNEIIDKVIAIFFPSPNSFTGEDILEIHGHGGKFIIDSLLQNILTIKPSIRIAHPGEFTKRAFLNNKIDLIKAEAIADLINAKSDQAAKSAFNSLEGMLSKKIKLLINLITELRMHIEISIDFSEENISSISYDEIKQKISNIINYIKKTYNTAYQGSLLNEEIKIVIAGAPNVGKSSLLNLISEKEIAITTNIPGTTRDTIKERLYLNGIPCCIIDTAGLHKPADPIECIGIERAINEISIADYILYITDCIHCPLNQKNIKILINNNYFSNKNNITIIRNKADLTKEPIKIQKIDKFNIITMSVKYKKGIQILKEYLINKISASYNNENIFIARKRHLESLQKTLKHLIKIEKQINHKNATFDMLAEELRIAHKCLKEIIGEFYSQELLDKIFSTFCIGK